jgi:predicted RNA-binding protein with PUA-like domain
MAHWLFQGNPKYYRIFDAIKDFEQMPWLVTRYAKDMAIGDGVLLWISGKQAGIYAIAEIIEPPKKWEQRPDIGYWTELGKRKLAPDSLHAKLRITGKLLDKPLLRSNLINDEILKNLMVIRVPNSTNFKLLAEQWQRVFELKE